MGNSESRPPDYMDAEHDMSNIRPEIGSILQFPRLTTCLSRLCLYIYRIINIYFYGVFIQIGFNLVVDLYIA